VTVEWMASRSLCTALPARPVASGAPSTGVANLLFGSLANPGGLADMWRKSVCPAQYPLHPSPDYFLVFSVWDERYLPVLG
jgi:hypothetical protein